MRKIENIIERFEDIHHGKYVYDKVDFVNIRTKVLIGCRKHGYFEQTPKNHLKGQGCPLCGKEVARDRSDFTIKNHRKTTDEFKNDIREKYGDKYTILSEYVNNKTEIKVFCNELDENGRPHGEFLTKPNYLLNGHECRLCANKKISKARRTFPKKIKEKGISKRIVPFDVFQKKLNEKVGDNFSIDVADFKNMSSGILIKCNVCKNTFYRKPTVLLHSLSTCPHCSKEINNNKRMKSLEEFIEKANEVHNNFYSYEKTIYNGSSNYVIVTCPQHGDFTIEANSHLMGHGCPLHYCNKSKQEEELQEFVKSLVGGECVFNSKKILESNQELDIFIPSRRIAIEYNGLYWHNELNKPNNYHLEKTNECKKLEIDLMHIFEDEWTYKKDIVKSIIKNKLGLTETKIYARKCTIKAVPSEESSKFLDANHLQGKCGGHIRLGLYFNDELVSLMVFGASRHFIGDGEEKYELIRFANKLNTLVIGGASKLFKFFLNTVNPNKVVSYADKRISNGNLYNLLGFTKYNESKPNYYYVINNRRIYRFNLRKSVLVKKYGCAQEESERKFCLKQKWYRIYDCGCLCYEWKKK